MPIPKRKPSPYKAERDRLLEVLKTTDPSTDEYHKVMAELDRLDKILNRTKLERFKTVIPAAGTAVAIGGVYALQQFGGIIVPKALESIAARQEQKKSQKDD